jgi:hypothetical protein
VKNNHQQLETIYCDGCGVPINQSNGKFLRPVIMLCGQCQHRNEWHPAKKAIDKSRQKAEKD